jgi:predicted dienelactone hydrolase
VNLSLLVQCQALQLPRKDYNFRDPRIKAASVLFPGSSSLFGQSGLSQINVPVLWGAVSKDIFSSLALEQLPAFSSLRTPNKYLVVAEGIDHLNLNFYALRTLKTMDQASADAVTLKAPDAAKAYLKALNLAFFQVYLSDRPEYRPYLTASYAKSISQDSHSFLLLKSLADVYSAR